MCGVFGLVGVRSDASKIFDRMGELLFHRGPDEQSAFIDKSQNLFLGGTRLSIQDPLRGAQPFWSQDRKVCVFANCEIYNFIELNQIIAANDLTIDTGSDVETILKLYQLYGLDFKRLLLGMYAIVIYDSQADEVILMRDPMGEKPLYMMQAASGGFVFASEQKAIIKSGIQKFHFNRECLTYYFKYGFIPEEVDVFDEIKRIPAGATTRISLLNYEVQTEVFSWDNNSSQEYQFHKESFGDTLQNAIEISLRSDVPIAIALSGGIDSSMIALAANDLGKDITAISIGYEDHFNQDESGAAGQFARTLEMNFIQCRLTSKEIAHSFLGMCQSFDTPIADQASPAYWALAAKANSLDIKVLVTGQGSDELYWGYPWVSKAVFKNLRRFRYFNNEATFLSYFGFVRLDSIKPRELVRAIFNCFGLLDAVIEFTSDRRDKKSENYTLKLYDYHPDSRLRKRLMKKLIPDQAPLSDKCDVKVPLNTENIPEILRAILVKTYLRTNGLEQVDRLFMANQVEGRTPFLDMRLVNSALRSEDNRFAVADGKKYLRKAIQSVRTQTFLNRPKSGFGVPARKWHQAISDLHVSELSKSITVEHGILAKFATNYVKNPLTRTGRVKKLWLEIAVLEFWFSDISEYLVIEN